MEKPILITGAAGFVGRNVVREFLNAGKRVRAMVRSSPQAAMLESDGAETVMADLTDPESLRAAVDGVEGVVHIAALFRRAGLPDTEYYKVNVEGTRALLDYSVTYGIKRFIHCSTVGVHGNVENPPGDESSPFHPGDIYQRMKVEGELLVQRYLNEGKLHGIVIRPAMIYGPHDGRTRKIFSMVANRVFFYVGAGDKQVHFIDVRDLARAFRQAFERMDLTAKTYIIAGREAMPLREFVRRVALILDVPEPWIHIPVRPMQMLGSICEAICTPLRIQPPLYRRRVDFYTKSRHFDTRRARDELGFEPEKDSLDELVDIINSYIEEGVIKGSVLSPACRIERTPSGVIRSWDSKAEAFYGWSAPDALGKVSHELLKSKFPSPLELIDRQVSSDGQWVGNLRHITSRGRALSVLSRWSLHESREGKAVAEVNRVRC